MKKYILMLGVLIVMSACTGLSKEEKEKQIQDSIAMMDSTFKADSIAKAVYDAKVADSIRIADSLSKIKQVKK